MLDFHTRRAASLSLKVATECSCALMGSLLLAGSEGEDFTSTVFGPTCDGLDTILRGVMLPRLHVGDWLVFNRMGAYTMTGASAFNGIDPTEASIFYVQSEEMTAKSKA